jgi:hypothetical protein
MIFPGSGSDQKFRIRLHNTALEITNATAGIRKHKYCLKQEVVVSFLNRTARNAIENQEEIQDQQVFISVKTAIEERVLDLALSSKEKPVTLPKVSFFRSRILRIRNY